MPELNIKLVVDGKDLEAKLNLSKEQLRQIRGESENFSDSVSKWGMMVTGFNQALEVAKKVYDVISKPLEAAGQFEQYTTSLKVMLGSSEAAKARLQELVDFAKSTPFELPQVVEAANQLQAIGRYSQDNLRMLGDLASASGKPMEQALSAYSKLMTGQKGIAIDMFRDMLISADDWAKATGAKIGANGELQASVEQMAEALPRILKEKGFNGMMQAQSETFGGMVSNMKDAFGQMETALGEKLLPYGKAVATMLGEVAGALTPTKTNLDAANESAENQRLAFEKLVIQYEDLRSKSSLNNDEANRYSGIIDTLQKQYPAILGNMDLQKGKLEDIRQGFENVRKEMETNIRLELRQAAAKDYIKEQEDAIQVRDKANGALLDARAKLKMIQSGQMEDTHITGTDSKGRTTVVGKLSEQLAEDIKIYSNQIDDAELIIKTKQFQIDNALNGTSLPGGSTTPVTKGTTPTTPKGKSDKSFTSALDELGEKEGKQLEDQLKGATKYLDVFVETSSRKLIEQSEAAIKQAEEEAKATKKLQEDKTALMNEMADQDTYEINQKRAAASSMVDLDQWRVSEKARLQKIESDISTAKTQEELEALKRQRNITENNIALIEEEKRVRLEAAAAAIQAGYQEYDASKSLGEQMKEITRNNLKRIIAETVMTQIAKVIAMIPWPFNLVAAPAAGLLLQGMLEKLIPKFGEGGLPQGRNALVMVNDKDGEQEFIANGQATRRFLPQLMAMNAGQDPFMMSVLNARLAIEHSLAASSGGSDSGIKEEFKRLSQEIRDLAKRPGISYVSEREFNRARLKGESNDRSGTL